MSEDLPVSFWAIGGGKGGVGKSVTSVALAYWLGRLNKKVILVDADLGGANLHTMLGIRIPQTSLDDFVLKRAQSLEDVLIETSLPNVRLLAGGSEIPSLANPNYGQKTRILRALHKLNADYILVDIGAGSGFTQLDFFLAAPHRLVVMSPQPTSIENAYGFIKAAVYRQLAAILKNTPLKGWLEGTGSENRAIPQSCEEILTEVRAQAPEQVAAVESALAAFHVRLVVNMARSARDEKAGDVIRKVCERFLDIQVDCLGAIPLHPAMERWAATMGKESPGKEWSEEVLRSTYQIAYQILTRPDVPQRRAA